jgi:hypothetical protein
VALDHGLAAGHLAVLLIRQHECLAGSSAEGNCEELGRRGDVVAVSGFGGELKTGVCVVCPIRLGEYMAAESNG